jgi:hypothetical protein
MKIEKQHLPGGKSMERRKWVTMVGIAAAVWSAVRSESYFGPGGLLELGPLDLPVGIRAFFVAAMLAGVVGGVALSLDRRGAASLLSFSWLGVLIEGKWGPGLLGVRLDLGVTEFLLTSGFALVAHWNSKNRSRI